MQLQSPDPMTVLVVDDQRSTRTLLAAALKAMGHAVLEADGAEPALALFEQRRPDLALLDVEMPGHDGYWLARQMRAAERGGWTPIVFLSGRDGDVDLCRGIEAGGDDYLVKPVSPTVLHAKLMAMARLLRTRQRLEQISEDLRAANQRLSHISDTDPLTGLLNRRALDTRLRAEIARARHARAPLTLMLCDIDHFKAYNDTLGHPAGDAALQRVSALLQASCLRPNDRAARYGGEEFALLLPVTPRRGALTFARGLLRTLQGMQLPHPASPTGAHLTLSGGITTCVPDDGTTPERLIERADEALYVAKARGRARLFSFEMQLDTLESAVG